MKTIVFLIFVLSVGDLFSQSTENYLSIDGVEYLGNPTPIKRKIPYERIQGSPYHKDKLISGSLITTNSDSLKRYMRFNAYTNEIEYVENEIIKELINPLIVERIYLNNRIYQYKRYESGNGIKETWMMLLVEGRCNLYKRELVEFKDEEAAESSYQSGSPARFVNLAAEYFATCGEQEIIPISLNKSSIVSFFGTHGYSAEEIIKDNKLKPRKEEDLGRLFTIINEIR